MIMLCLVGLVVAWLAFGERGFVHLYHTEMERQDNIEKIRRLADENRTLREEIDRLRNDLKYVESVARRELNLIRENEIIYRFKEEKPCTEVAGKISPESQGAEKNNKSGKEVQRHGGIK